MISLVSIVFYGALAFAAPKQVHNPADPDLLREDLYDQVERNLEAHLGGLASAGATVRFEKVCENGITDKGRDSTEDLDQSPTETPTKTNRASGESVQ